LTTFFGGKIDIISDTVFKSKFAGARGVGGGRRLISFALWLRLRHIQDEAQRALKLLGQGKYDEILEHVHRAPPNDLVFVCTSFPVGMSLQTPLLTWYDMVLYPSTLITLRLLLLLLLLLCSLDAFESAMSEKCEKNPQLLVRVPSMAKLLMAAAEADAQKNVKPFLVMWVTERPVAHSLSDMKDWADTVHGVTPPPSPPPAPSLFSSKPCFKIIYDKTDLEECA
jgi:hypothetical protein